MPFGCIDSRFWVESLSQEWSPPRIFLMSLLGYFTWLNGQKKKNKSDYCPKCQALPNHSLTFHVKRKKPFFHDEFKGLIINMGQMHPREKVIKFQLTKTSYLLKTWLTATFHYIGLEIPWVDPFSSNGLRTPQERTKGELFRTQFLETLEKIPTGEFDLSVYLYHV